MQGQGCDNMKNQPTLAIDMHNVNKSYGQSRGIKDLTLRVGANEIVGFIGPNGAGKSTTIRLLMGMIKPQSGEIALFGKPLKMDEPMLRRKIGYMPSEIRFYADFTGKQMLELAAGLHGIDFTKTRIPEYAQRLDWDMSARIRSYSLGNRKKLGVLVALLHSPELLILDEPTSGLDPLAQQNLFAIIRELNESMGTTVFLSTHVLSEVDKLCRRVVFIQEGSIIQDTNLSELTRGGVHLYEVVFQSDGDVRQASGLLNVDANCEYRDGICSGKVEDHQLNRFLKVLASIPVKHLTLRKLSLEERFMASYDRKMDKEGDCANGSFV
jgi:ABC-2 type transport system ATP-binding protein